MQVYKPWTLGVRWIGRAASLAACVAVSVGLSQTGWGQCVKGIETVAGLVALGDGLPATTAQLLRPRGMVVDGAGNVYIADTEHHRVRKVTPGGTIMTIAGTGVAGGGGDGGPAVHATLNTPSGLAMDAAGNLYIADTNNHRLRKVDTTGVITTVAGNGSRGYSGDEGPATAARLYWPSGVALDASGNVYIADAVNNRIRKVDTTGVITTVAGNGMYGYTGDNGPATAAQINFPNGVAVDSAGNVYIADTNNNRIRKVDTSGVITTVAGNGTSGYNGDGGPATAAQLASPFGVAVDSGGNLYIADTSNLRIRKVDTSGSITTAAGGGLAGLGDGGPATTAWLSLPRGVTVDAPGNLYIADTRNHRIRKVDSSGMITTLAGNGTYGPSGDGGSATSAALTQPRGVAVGAAGNVYIADSGSSRIRKVDTAGVITTVAGGGFTGLGDGGPATAARLSYPSAVAVDAPSNMYIADSFNHRIRKVDTSGVITTVAGTGIAGYGGDGASATAAQLNNPYGLAVDAAGNIYIADSFNHRIRKVDTSGVVTTVAGTGIAGYGGDGASATAAQIDSPYGVAVDAAGNLYIADTYNNRIRKVSASGVITTVAGIGTNGSAGDGGPATAAQLANPVAVAVDAAGNLYIADRYNHRIRKVDTSGVITTVAGSGTLGYSGDGDLATAAQLNNPYGVTVDAAGNLYIADTENYLIRRVDPACQVEPAVAFRDSNSGISVANRSGNLFPLGGLFAGDPGVGVVGGGRMVVAARDAFNSLRVNVVDPRTGTANGWQPVGGLMQGTPGVGVVNTGSGTVAQVVVRDQWNSYWALSYNVSTGTVVSWQPLLGIFTTDPAVAACADGTIYVVGRDQWGSLWSRRWIPAAGWGPWVWGMGITQGKPAVTCGRNQVVHVAVRDNWDTLWLARVSGNVWQGWQWAGGVMQGDPEIASLGNGQVQASLRDAWGGVWTRSYDEDSQSWGGWVFTNGVLTRQAPAAAGGALHVLGTDAGNGLWRYAAGLNQWAWLGHANAGSGRLAAAPR